MSCHSSVHVIENEREPESTKNSDIVLFTTIKWRLCMVEWSCPRPTKPDDVLLLRESAVKQFINRWYLSKGRCWLILQCNSGRTAQAAETRYDSQTERWVFVLSIVFVSIRGTLYELPLLIYQRLQITHKKKEKWSKKKRNGVVIQIIYTVLTPRWIWCCVTCLEFILQPYLRIRFRATDK